MMTERWSRFLCGFSAGVLLSAIGHTAIVVRDTDLLAMTIAGRAALISFMVLGIVLLGYLFVIGTARWPEYGGKR